MKASTNFTFTPKFFDEEKSIELILYLAQNIKEPTFHQIAKLMYFADKCHLEHYGRLMMEETYIAMKHGPVPSLVYHILTAYRTFPPQNAAFIVVNKFEIKPKRMANLDNLSESEIKSLDYSIKNYSHCSFGELTKLSHDSAWESADRNDEISIEEIVKTLPNSKDLLDHLFSN